MLIFMLPIAYPTLEEDLKVGLQNDMSYFYYILIFSSGETVASGVYSFDELDNPPTAETPDTSRDAIVLKTADDFITAVMERIGNLKTLFKQDRQLAMNLLAFFELIGNESITSEFLPLNLFLEAVDKKGADIYGMRAPKISENSKILYTFGYRYIILSN